MANVRVFAIEDHRQALQLWETTEGVGLSEADSRENIERFLSRNPSFSFVAVDGDALIATILCGHDGRRGLIHHLVVAPAYRQNGLGRELVTRALAALHDAKIQKCHLLVFRENSAGRAFWERIGAEERMTLSTFSLQTGARSLGAACPSADDGYS